jgi:hypothetical protein
MTWLCKDQIRFPISSSLSRRWRSESCSWHLPVAMVWVHADACCTLLTLLATVHGRACLRIGFGKLAFASVHVLCRPMSRRGLVPVLAISHSAGGRNTAQASLATCRFHCHALIITKRGMFSIAALISLLRMRISCSRLRRLCQRLLRLGMRNTADHKMCGCSCWRKSAFIRKV